ncbi:hypothetical protein NE237_011489 [Protea cynaroides]|uniref:Pentatricopeptide repeat-containing protein n=1 Tax=Protea cynaroides TaxID=273540 RepID=A0A9Q0JWU2_9MAGN|nr:hypothetical protein NE237_011489 [Protea cynaroides]
MLKRQKKDQDCNDNGRLQTVEAPKDSSCILKCEKTGGLGISTLEVQGNAPCPPPEMLHDEGNEEPSLAECEELYGPDKEPLAERFPQIESREQDKMVIDMTSTEKIAFSENESCKENIVARSSNIVMDSFSENMSITGKFAADHNSSGGEKSSNFSSMSQNVRRKDLKCNDEQSGISHSISKKAGVDANIVTHNLLTKAYCDCSKTDTALEHYKQLINDASFNPSPTTYRILVKGLVDYNKVDRALELKDEVLEKGLAPDTVVYNYLMLGLVKKSDLDGVLALYEELREKQGFLSHGMVYGDLMKGYFLKGMEKEAMDCYEEAVGENSKVKMTAVAYNSVLDALSKNGKFEEAMRLFDRMMVEHNPPNR